MKFALNAHLHTWNNLWLMHGCLSYLEIHGALSLPGDPEVLEGRSHQAAPLHQALPWFPFLQATLYLLEVLEFPEVVDTLDIQDCNSKGGEWVQSDFFFFENIHLHRIKVQTCPQHRLHTRFVWLVYITSFCGVHGNLSYIYRTIIVPNSCGIYG